MKFWIPLTVLCLSAASVAAQSIDQSRVEALVAAQTVLQETIAQRCQQGTPPDLNAFRNAATQWMTVQALQLPASEFLQTDHRFVFWPDPKDRLKRQVQTALTTPPDATDWSALPSSVTSLSAIELILTDATPLSHCPWLNAIADYQVKQTDELAKLQQFYTFGTAEQLTALHGTALTLHAILKEIISREDRTLWVLAPAWRSETGPDIANALIQQSLELMQLFSEQNPELQLKIEEWQSRPRLSIDTPRAEIAQWNQAAEALAGYVEDTLAPSLNIFIGFNNFDGD
ncbi:hypothetical protein [Reinekea blandensis]|uniref:Imelysin-like domain-containing protein n=1 Tax=Reinekea blandensis MED297 TaxID=314283 RepID=A4BG14_9GAMM|nr:hypothetical protein [Reinekea blandensis]EAR09032.1 hypothetical protein MED297_04047 [Reinekea sp. MED297] [Reinekea blandensis MED297]